MGVVKETTKKIDEVVTAREAEVRQLEKAIAEARIAVDEGNRKMIEATDAADMAAYVAARDGVREAKNTIEFSEKRKKRITETPAVTEAEYMQTVKAIHAELDAANNEAKRALAGLMDEMKAIRDKLSVTIDEGNQVLTAWRQRVYLNADAVRVESGKIVTERDRSYKDFSVFEFLRMVESDGFYEAFTKSR